MAGRIHQAVVSVILEGLRRHAPEVLSDQDTVQRLLKAGTEGAPLEPYRGILAKSMALDGGRALLQAGEPLRELVHPLLFVLLNSDSPALIVEKQLRLAAFIHSRHHVQLEQVTESSITVLHVSTVPDDPEPTEDLAACGQQVVLFEEIGCQGLRCRLPNSLKPNRWIYENGVFSAPAPGEGYACWHFEWEAFKPTRRPMPGLDEVLLNQDEVQALQESLTVPEAVERFVRRDLGRTWRVSEVADGLGMSPRSLQRALTGAGTRYSDLLDRIRNTEAARLLEETTLSLTEIGYVCGFADSAHFSRSFKKRMRCTPSEHRRIQVG